MAILNIKHWFQKRESAISAVEVAREQMSRFNALLKSDPKDLTNAITSFDSGYLAPLAHLIEEYERRDDKMKTCSMKMKASVGRCDYSIQQREGFEDDPRADRHAEILKRFWSTVRTTSTFNRNETGGFNLLKKQMMDAQSYGYAVHELVWKPTPDGELRCEFIQVPLWHFENRTGSLRFLPTTTSYEGVNMKPGEWMVTTGDGVGIAAALCACMKRMGLVDWMIYNERCGMPLLHGSTGAAYGSDQWNNLNKAIKNIARYTQILTDSSTKVEAIPLGGGASIPYPQLIEWCDRAIAALYRGADLSTISQGGDGVGASLQGDESDMLEQDACGRLSDVLNEAVDRFVIRYVTGDDEPLARIVVEPVSKPNVDTDIKIDQHLVGMGVKLSKNDALQRYGRTEVDPNDAEDAALEQSGGQGLTALPGFANEENGGHAGRVTLPASVGASVPLARREPTDILAAFAKDTGPAADAIKELLKNPSKEAAEALMKNLGSLMPDDPALAAVIAEAMAKEFGEGGTRSVASAPLANAITNPCPKCHRQMSADGTCTSCAKRAANHANGKTAFEEVSKSHADKVGAMERDAIGKIDFIWGDDSEGICHILGKHPGDAQMIPGVIAYGDVYDDKANGKFYIVKKRNLVVLRKREGANHYLITGYRKDDPNAIAKIRKEYDLVEEGA